MPGFFKPNNADSIDVAFGVDTSLANFIIQNITISQSTQNLEIADQKGRTAQVISYDKGKTLTFSMIGDRSQLPAEMKVNGVITIDGTTGSISVAAGSASGVAGAANKYVIQSFDEACTYNDTTKWNVTAQGWEHAKYFDKSDSEL